MLEELEAVLWSKAVPYTPVGSDTKAVIHQWVHAIAHDKPLFGDSKGAKRTAIVKILKENGLFKNESMLRDALNAGLPISVPNGAKFTFIDLFAGIGGMRIGAQNNGGVCVFSSEFEKNAQKTYLDNYGELPFGDITKISAEDIPEHDVLFAGFPCQPFSNTGLQKGNKLKCVH
ncbi:MAG: DNA (cytosine-5-)-methyltransferase [Methylococcaceae bacterium]|nr:DNA (cytosine-5-)-methyltransferase [Methylococcaceae bacterium]